MILDPVCLTAIIKGQALRSAGKGLREMIAYIILVKMSLVESL